MKTRIVFQYLMAAAVFLAAGQQKASAQPESSFTELISIGYDGSPANGQSENPAISPDDRYVAFASEASNLVSGDTNGEKDVFVHDRSTGTTFRVSIASDGTQGNGDSWNPTLSAGGRFVSFTSEANNLVSDDTNVNCLDYEYWVIPFCQDIFVHDLTTGETQRVSIGNAGEQGNGNSWSSKISADGRFVAFSSLSSNFSDGDSGNLTDAFVHDRQTGMTERIGQGNFADALSPDGRYVLVQSSERYIATPIYIFDRQTSFYEEAGIRPPGWPQPSYGDRSWGISISADARYVFFSYCFYKTCYLFLRDRQAGYTEVLPPYAMTFTGASISQDARFLAWSEFYFISADPNQVLGYDRLTGVEEQVSVSAVGSKPNGDSWSPSISADGFYVAFISQASNLVDGDTNNLPDIFVRDRRAMVIHPPWRRFLPLVAR